MNLNSKRQKIVRKLTNKEYRDAWVDESAKTVVPFQIQALRNQRDWSQELLGKKSGMLRNAITRLESVDYGNLNINTLLRIAHGLDCGLLVRFVPFSRMVRELEDVSPKALEVESFEEDLPELNRWAENILEETKMDDLKPEAVESAKTGSYSNYPDFTFFVVHKEKQNVKKDAVTYFISKKQKTNEQEGKKFAVELAGVPMPFPEDNTGTTNLSS